MLKQLERANAKEFTGVWQIAYRRGYREPNYPVPALPMVVDIAPDYCAVFVWHGPTMTGDYVYYVAGNDPNTETLP